MKIAILISALYKHYYYYYYYYYYWMFFSGSTSLENTTVEKSVNMNTTVNGSSSWNCPSLINPEAGKIGLTVALGLILAVSLIGNFLIVLLVYKTPTLRPVSNVVLLPC